jgi:hypothetical protein
MHLVAPGTCLARILDGSAEHQIVWLRDLHSKQRYFQAEVLGFGGNGQSSRSYCLGAVTNAVNGLRRP